MIPGRGEWIWKALQDTDIRVEYAAGLTVQQLGGTIHGGAERDADGLVAQADPQQRRVRGGAGADQADRRARAFGSTRTRAEEHTVELRGGRWPSPSPDSRASSLRHTSAWTPSCPRYCTRLNTKLS